MAILLHRRCILTVGFLTASAMVGVLALSPSNALRARADEPVAVQRTPQPFDNVVQASGNNPSTDINDPFATPAAQTPPQTLPGTGPTAPNNPIPDVTAPATPTTEPSGRPATAPGTMPQENPFGQAIPTPGADNTTPQLPQPQPQNDTMPVPGAAQPGAAEGPGAAQPGSEYSPAQQQISAAADLINQGHYIEALHQLDESIQANPREAAAYFYQGVAFRMLNHYDEAIDAFTKTIQLDQSGYIAPEAFLRRGVAWFYKGEYGIAWQDFDEASALLYDEPLPELWKGLARARQQNWLDAVNSYAVALQHDDKFTPAWINMGLGYLALNEPNKALYALNQAVRNDPRNATSYFKRGIALSRLGRFREAADSYSEAIRIKPDYAEAYFNRSLVNRDLGNSQQAEKDRAEALKLNPQIEKQLTSAG